VTELINVPRRALGPDTPREGCIAGLGARAPSPVATGCQVGDCKPFDPQELQVVRREPLLTNSLRSQLPDFTPLRASAAHS